MYVCITQKCIYILSRNKSLKLTQERRDGKQDYRVEKKFLRKQ